MVKEENNITYVFSDNKENEVYEYDLDSWNWDKEAIYKDVINSKFPNSPYCFKTKWRNWEFVYQNYFHIEKRQTTWILIFKKTQNG